MSFDYQRPQYEITVIRGRRNRPEFIYIEAIMRGGVMIPHDTVFVAIGDALRAAVYQQLREWPALWQNGAPRQRVTGMLLMNNLNDNKGAHTENMRPSEINFSAIQEIFERATTSGSTPDLDIYDVKFGYWINPLSFTQGAGNGSQVFAERTPGILKESYKVPMLKGNQPLNCAAYGIAYTLLKQDYYGKSAKAHASRPTFMAKKTLEIMNQLDWGDTISIANLQDFTDHFKDWRIVVVSRVTREGSIDFKGIICT